LFARFTSQKVTLLSLDMDFKMATMNKMCCYKNIATGRQEHLENSK